MDYITMIKALELEKHKEKIYSLKDKILPEVWIEIEKYFEGLNKC